MISPLDIEDVSDTQLCPPLFIAKSGDQTLTNYPYKVCANVAAVATRGTGLVRRCFVLKFTYYVSLKKNKAC